MSISNQGTSIEDANVQPRLNGVATVDRLISRRAIKRATNIGTERSSQPLSAPNETERNHQDDPRDEATNSNDLSETSRASWLKRMRNAIFATALLVIIGIMFWQYSSDKVLNSLTHIVSDDAYVSDRISLLGTSSSGIVGELYFSEGDVVAAGDVIAKLDDKVLISEVNELNSKLLKAEAAVNSYEKEIASQERVLNAEIQNANVKAKLAQQELAAAQSQIAFHHRQVDRIQKGFNKGVNSATEVDRRRSSLQTQNNLVSIRGVELKVAETARVTATERKALIEAMQAKLAVLRTDVATAKAAIDLAKSKLEQMKILAPTNGRILKIEKPVGSSIRVGQPAIVFLPEQPTVVEAWIEESYLPQLSKKGFAKVKFPALSGESFRGRIKRLGYHSDKVMIGNDWKKEWQREQSAQPQKFLHDKAKIRIEIELDKEPKSDLFPGLSAVVMIER